MRRLVVAALVLAACKPAGGPTVDAEAGTAIVEAGTVAVEGVCSLLEGVDSSGTVASICATVEEVATVVGFILTLRSGDAGATSGKCTVLPKSTLCATPQEIHKGVRFLVMQRRATLLLDGGAR